MKKFMKTVICMVGVLACLGLVNQAQANNVTVGFTRITTNSSTDVASQLSATLWEYDQANTAFALGLSSDEVLVTIQNDVGLQSSIHEVYFDDGTLVAQTDLFNSLGGFTDYVATPINPSNLPSGSSASPPFVATVGYGADIDSGGPNNGVNAAADILGISLEIMTPPAGMTKYEYTYAALMDGSLRIGLHVGALADGASDSFVNGPPPDFPPGPVIPEPATMFLLGTGLVGVAGASRRRKKNQA